MLLVQLAALVAPVAAYETFPFQCTGNQQFLRTRLDPLINSGKISSHVHAIAGTSNFLAEQSFNQSRAGECTTSYIRDDMSSYWAPQLYYKWKNGTFTAIQGDGLISYWKYASNYAGETFAVVPDDFRMYAGDPTRDHYDPTNASHQAISFECIGDGYDYRLPWIPSDLECKWLRPQAFFPNCWNGKDSYLPNNQHVRYPTGDNYEGGPCPAGFVRIPSLFLETYYKMPESLGPEYEWYEGSLVLSNGDNNGFTFHADWINGWPSGLLVKAYEECTDTLRGNVNGCPIFEASIDEDKAFNCYAQGEVATEPIGLDIPLAQLPGNNPVFNSSRDSPDYPKRAFADYIETAQIVPVDANGTGTCTRRCHDYTLEVAP